MANGADSYCGFVLLGNLSPGKKPSSIPKTVVNARETNLKSRKVARNKNF